MDDVPLTLEPAPRLRHVLREETRALHERLDSLPALAKLGEASIDRSTFIDLTARFLTYYRALDRLVVEACASSDALIAPFDYAPRAELLAGDLASLTARDDATYIFGSATRREPELPAIDDLGALIGVLYVVEGSVLGGAVLEPNCRKFFSAEFAPESYWAWCRSHGPQRWKATVALLDRVALDDDGRLSAVTAACRTFSTLAEHLLAPAGESHGLGSLAATATGCGSTRLPGW
ncbi:MAG: hypothetical protein GC150_14305 [Rhizobiales bacterium]|nr:hypothetical protein [Hyphomicrobiales bacterium]